MDGNLLATLAARFGTPLFVYDRGAIETAIARVRCELRYRPLRIYYSAKANPAVGIARVMRDAGIGLDACSPGDVLLAERAGFTREQISYTGFGYSDAELDLAARTAVDVTLDSVEEVKRYGQLRPGGRTGLRVNPDIAVGFHAHLVAGSAEAKFGLSHAELPRAFATAKRAGVAIVGLHVHLGSDQLTAAAHAEALTQLVQIARGWPQITWLNLGGGFGTPRQDGEADYPWDDLAAAAEQVLASSRRLELRIEPGQHFLMDAGALVGRVLAVRPANHSRPETLVLDASTNQLVSRLVYASHHPIALVNKSAAGSLRTYRVVGNLMQAGDVIAEAAMLPPVDPGDLVAIGRVGAYASSRATTFNERPRPAEILVDGDAYVVLRRAETLDDLFARDLADRRVF